MYAGMIGRILAAIALVSYWFLPITGTATTQDALNSYFDYIRFMLKAASEFGHFELDTNIELGLMQIILVSLSGIWALLNSRLFMQAWGGIIGLIVWIWSLNSGPVEVRAIGELKGGAYISMIAFLVLAVLTLIARVGSQIRASRAPVSPTPVDSLFRYCPSCGMHNPAGSRFCGKCGTALVQADSARKAGNDFPQATQRSCKKCGAAIEPGDAFCGRCGTTVEKTR